METAFKTAVREHLQMISPTILSDNTFSETETYILDYAQEKQLYNTAVALPLVRFLAAHAAQHPDSRFRNADMHMAYYHHSLSVCRILVDLHIPVEPEKEDTVLASAICHILPESIHFDNLEATLCETYRLSHKVYDTVQLLFWKDNNSGADELNYYQQLQKNPAALLVKLADRGNLVEQLHSISGWSARKYLHETKTFFFPMCIYAKEQYPSLLAPVSILMEKMRCLTEAIEILLSRYELLEAELTQEILALQEENATIRRMIHQLKN